MRYLKTCSLLVFLFVTRKTISQENFSALGETALGVTKTVSNKYDMNFTLRSRYFLHEDRGIQYNQQQIDAFHLSKLKLDKSHAVSLGVYYRTRDPFDSGSDELRFMQQFSYSKQKRNTKYNHRFRAEQRIFDSKTVFRERYRFKADFPLNGEKTAIGQAYLSTYIEGLLNIGKSQKPETDLRFTTQIGWKITEKLKLQTGLEHRLEGFNLAAKNYLFLLTSASYKI